jgi:hypothetical protein
VRAIAIVIAVFSVMVFVMGRTQTARNRMLLADMRDRVDAVRAFQSKEGRLPSESEVASISRELPWRSDDYPYYIYTAPDQFRDSRFQSEPPASGGWVLAFWRGESHAYYCSWDDYYNLSDELSVWSYSITWFAALGLATSVAYLLVNKRRAARPDDRDRTL